MTAAGEQAAKSAIPRTGILQDMGGRTNLLLWLLVVYLILEYARPPVVVQFKLQMLISLALPVLCYFGIKDRRWSFTLTCQLGILAIAALGIPFARNYYAAYFITRTLYTTIAISISMAWLLSRDLFFRRSMWAWTLIMAYVGLFGIAAGGTGPGGFVGDENDLALACNTAIPMAYFGSVYSKGWRRWLYAAIGVVLVMAVVASNSRGGFVGLAAMTLYMILISKHRIRAFAIVMVAGSVFYVAAPAKYIDEILSIQKEASGEVEGGTGDGRLFLWHAAFNMWKAFPIAGVGAGNAIYYTGEFQPDWEGSLYSERDWSGTEIHSAYFQVLAELGAIGVFFYGGMLVNHFRMLRQLRRSARSLKRIPDSLHRDIEMYLGALGGGMIGYMGSGVFLSVAYYPYAFYLSALSVAFCWSAEVQLQRLAEMAAARSRNPSATGTARDHPTPDSTGASPDTSTNRSSNGSLGKGLFADRR